ncbi:amino acid ABC transporter permease [Eubacteriales bacterium OttesenSCG-928-A19]|nr:amino acid ABC transporter permease [Eubacteriales bacterium OttesenSCG-928-A19]
MIENTIKVITRYGFLFLDGVKYTLLLSAISVFFGAILGSLLAMMRMAKLKVIRLVATVYIEIIRGTPLLLQLYFFYFLLPEVLPFMDNKFLCIAVALTFNSAAYVSEIVRAGIQAVDKGQTEAARSLGLSSRQTMLRIILPQAVKNILPALCNEFIMIIKETSLASTFFIGDIMTQYRIISGALYLVIEPLIVAGVIYFILTFSLSKLVAVYERRMKVSD